MFFANVVGKEFDRGERKGIAEFAEQIFEPPGHSRFVILFRRGSGGGTFWDGGGALQPPGVPQVQQHLRAGGEAVGGEIEGGWGARSCESAGFFKRVDIFYQAVRRS